MVRQGFTGSAFGVVWSRCLKSLPSSGESLVLSAAPSMISVGIRLTLCSKCSGYSFRSRCITASGHGYSLPFFPQVQVQWGRRCSEPLHVAARDQEAG